MPGKSRQVAWISLGSNLNPEVEIHRALTQLEQTFGKLTLSQTYRSEPVGLNVDHCAPFLNLVAGLTTELTPQALVKRLKAIEGPTPSQAPANHYCRALDLDLICLGAFQGHFGRLVLPYPSLLKHDFVLRPMAELTPHQTPPGYALSYQQLWQLHAHADQRMQAVELDWLPGAPK